MSVAVTSRPDRDSSLLRFSVRVIINPTTNLLKLLPGLWLHLREPKTSTGVQQG